MEAMKLLISLPFCRTGTVLASPVRKCNE